jgi:hypothetical protein
MCVRLGARCDVVKFVENEDAKRSDDQNRSELLQSGKRTI